MFEIGTRLKVDDIEGLVIGYIVYRNNNDSDRDWIEYRLETGEGEHWLSWDDYYGEYSLSWPSRLERGNKIPDKWKKVDEGSQVVFFCEGDVDVEAGDSCHFVEYEDETEEEIFSIELWEDGTEVSEGYYLDREEIQVLGHTAGSSTKRSSSRHKFVDVLFLLFIVIVGLFTALEEEFDFDFGFGHHEEVSLSSYIESDANKYEYITSLTGNEGNRASVYKFRNTVNTPTTNMVAIDLIQAIGGETEVVTANEGDDGDASVSILTRREYALIYYPEGENAVVYVQVSDRKYNYTSDQQPYRSRASTHSWYRRHYYSSGYSADSTKWSGTPSAYKTYDGPIVKDLGNGYFDVYSNSVRQSTIRQRKSDGGGLSGGK